MGSENQKRFHFLAKNATVYTETVTYKLGQREEGDRLVVCEEIKESKCFMKKVSVLRAFSTLNPNARITYVEAASLSPGRKCTRHNQAEIRVDGGPGKDHAVIKIKGKRHLNIHYKISIYAIGAWTVAEMEEEKRKKLMEKNIYERGFKYTDVNFDHRRRGFLSMIVDGDLEDILGLDQMPMRGRRLSEGEFTISEEEHPEVESDYELVEVDESGRLNKVEKVTEV